MKQIELIEVSKWYLKDIYNLLIKRSSFWLITGANGSGKSTILRMILNFLKPDQGKIYRQVNLKIGYLPERVELPQFIKVITYLEIIANLKKTTLDLSLLLDLEIPYNKKIAHLSKGNLQKVAIVATLIGENDLVILDEPLSGLDQKMTNKLKQIIETYQKKGITFIVSTHNSDVFFSMASNHLSL